MANDEEPSNRGFKVQDRRRFSATGEARDSEAESTSAPSAAGGETPPEPPRPAEAPRPAERAESPHPAEAHRHAEAEINFATFVLSLSTQALAQLGEIPDPVDNTVHVDLVAARHFIDILAMLREKTMGNLDRDEADILEHALYDLRMRFVDHSQRR